MSRHGINRPRCANATPRQALLLGLVVGAVAAWGPGLARAQATNDPRVGLAGGHWIEAASAISNLELIAHVSRPNGFYNPSNPGDFAVANSDLAFAGNLAFQGNFNGIQVWDISDPRNPKLRTTLVCPGGQGEPSVYGHLLFMSVEETRARIDCGAQGVRDSVSAERFRGVRIFDISDLDHPKQVAAVQTCRGSHTHTLIPDPKDPNIVYVYVQGVAGVRSGSELAGCSGATPEVNPNTSLFRIEIIRVPLASPQDAKVINEPRIFANAATGAIAGLAKANPGDTLHGIQATSETNQCHDITSYPAIGLAAGACSGNGILLDIRDPANPKRVAEVSDPNFAYWHSATFSNDGKKVLFTDEWGGGVAPRCRATDPPKWGADAIFTLAPDHKMQFVGYYKLPAPQTEFENCVAHNGSLIPVPGRDIMAQAWYQGGVSIFDFTDPAHVHEIAFFDRGPLDAHKLYLGGFWSAFWYNGHIYGTEIARGLDVLDLKPSQYLSQNEIDAAKLIHVDTLNVRNQQRIVWPASFVVARAYIDQLTRDQGLSAAQLSQISTSLNAAEQMSGAKQLSALKKLASQVHADAKGSSDAARVHLLGGAIDALAAKPG